MTGTGIYSHIILEKSRETMCLVSLFDEIFFSESKSFIFPHESHIPLYNNQQNQQVTVCISILKNEKGFFLPFQGLWILIWSISAF